MADTVIKCSGYVTGLTMTVDIRNPTTLALLETVTMTESSEIYSGVADEAVSGLHMFVVKASGAAIDTQFRTIADDVGPYVIATQLEEVSLDPAAAYTITFVVTDDAGTPLDLENAAIRVVGNGVNRSKLTDANGEVAWALDAATYSVGVTMNGHDSLSTTLVVDASETVTYRLTPNAGGAVAATNMSTGTGMVYNELFAAEGGVPVSFKLMKGNGVAGRFLDQKSFTIISEDGTGGTVLGRIQSANFAQGCTYQKWRGAAADADASDGFAVRSDAQRTTLVVP
jgi:hypothetical protein